MEKHNWDSLTSCKSPDLAAGMSSACERVDNWWGFFSDIRRKWQLISYQRESVKVQNSKLNNQNLLLIYWVNKNFLCRIPPQKCWLREFARISPERKICREITDALKKEKFITQRCNHLRDLECSASPQISRRLPSRCTFSWFCLSPVFVVIYYVMFERLAALF